MAFQWTVLGKEDPLIRGSSAQFHDAATTFARIADNTDYLEDELAAIRFGNSSGFAGQASSAFHNAIDVSAAALRDLPWVSRNISDIFGDHQRQLEALHRTAESALARAETNWNSKITAQSDIATHQATLSTIDQQISALEYDLAASAEMLQLRSRHVQAAALLDAARSDFRRAEDRVDESKTEWEELRNKEDELNESTSSLLEHVELWNLKDPWHEKFSKAVQAVAVVWEAIHELIADLAEVLYEALDAILDVLDIVGIFLEFIPVIGQIYKLVEAGLIALKLSAGLILLLDGRISFAEFALDMAASLTGFLVPGGRLLAKGGAKLMKRAGPHLKQAARNAEAAAKETADVIETATKNAAKKIRQVGDKVGDKLEDDLVKGVAGDILDDVVEGTADVAADAIEQGGRHAAKAIRRGAKTGRATVDNAVDILNAQLPGEFERLADDMLEAAADQLSEVLEEWKDSLHYSRAPRSGKDPALAPCSLDERIDNVPDILVATGLASLVRAA